MIEELTHLQALFLGVLIGGTWGATVAIAYLVGLAHEIPDTSKRERASKQYSGAPGTDLS